MEETSMKDRKKQIYSLIFPCGNNKVLEFRLAYLKIKISTALRKSIPVLVTK